MILLFLGKAELVADREDRMFRSVSQSFPWPSVIRLNNFIHIPFKHIILSRKNILKRDGYRCAYCGRGDLTLTLDHIIPRSKGGQDTWENLVAACLPCNNKKGNKTLDEAQLSLRVRPYAPNHIMYIKNSAGKMDDTWKPFLFSA